MHITQINYALTNKSALVSWNHSNKMMEIVETIVQASFGCLAEALFLSKHYLLAARSILLAE